MPADEIRRAVVGGALVGPMLVVEGLELAQHMEQVPLVPDQRAIEQFTTASLHPPLHDRVRPRHPHTGQHHRDTRIRQNGVKEFRKPAVPAAPATASTAAPRASPGAAALGRLRCDYRGAIERKGVLVPAMSKVGLYAAIRRGARAGMSKWALQREFGVGFRTVQRALESAIPQPRKPLPPRASRPDPPKPVVDQMLRASELIVYDGRTEVARHERLLAKGASRLELDHCLEVLIRKSGALPGATALEQVKAAGKFTPVHEQWWARACQAHGGRDGTDSHRLARSRARAEQIAIS